MAADHGFGHITVQWDYAPQRPLLARLADECHALGLTFGMWEAEPEPGSGAALVYNAAKYGAPIDHYIAQAETPRDWPAIVADFREVYPSLPAAVVTTFVGLDPSQAAAINAAGFGCLVESYVNQDPNATPDAQVWTAETQLGFPYAQPVVGVWGDFPFSRYVSAYNLGAYPDYWVWLAETMTGNDWTDAGRFNLG